MNDPDLNFSSSRRGFLGLCLAGGGSFGLVACGSAASVCNADGWTVAFRPAGSFFDCHQMSVLSDLANLIVGEGDWPTADDVGVVTYLDQIFEVWAGPGLKARMSRLPEQLNRSAVQQHGSAYVQLDRIKRARTLAEYDAKAFKDREVEANATYIEFKSMVLKIYNTSAETNLDFVLVPGAYLGDLSASQYLELVREKAVGFAG